jgi:hypothetical protein
MKVAGKGTFMDGIEVPVDRAAGSFAAKAVLAACAVVLAAAAAAVLAAAAPR